MCRAASAFAMRSRIGGAGAPPHPLLQHASSRTSPPPPATQWRPVVGAPLPPPPSGNRRSSAPHLQPRLLRRPLSGLQRPAPLLRLPLRHVHLLVLAAAAGLGRCGPAYACRLPARAHSTRQGRAAGPSGVPPSCAAPAPVAWLPEWPALPVAPAARGPAARCPAPTGAHAYRARRRHAPCAWPEAAAAALGHSRRSGQRGGPSGPAWRLASMGASLCKRACRAPARPPVPPLAFGLGLSGRPGRCRRLLLLQLLPQLEAPRLAVPCHPHECLPAPGVPRCQRRGQVAVVVAAARVGAARQQ
jgi:hypothetical protein